MMMSNTILGDIMDLTGWTCSRYSLQKSGYRIMIMRNILFQVLDTRYELIAEFSGLMDAVSHVEKLLNTKDNV